MYRIMLADEGEQEVLFLKTLIMRTYGKECVVECVRTGREAVESADKFHPDIVIISNRLSGIGGIGAIKEMQIRNVNASCILIFECGRFEDAAEALRLGAVEFLNRPIERRPLLSALQRAVEQIDAKRKQREQELVLRNRIAEAEPVIESGFVNFLLFERPNSASFDRYRLLLNIVPAYGYMAVITNGTKAKNASAEDPDHDLMSIYGAELRQGIKESFGGIAGRVIAGKFAVYFPCEGETLDGAERNLLVMRMHEFLARIRKKTGMQLRVGIGCPGKPERMPESFREAVGALENLMGSVVCAQAISGASLTSKEPAIRAEKQLIETIEKGDTAEALRIADVYFTNLSEMCSGKAAEIRIRILDTVLYAERYAAEKGGQAAEMCSRREYLSTLMETEDLSELRHWFCDRILELCSSAIGRKKDRSNRIIEKAQLFIRENYKRDISLDDVSRNVNVSPYYFSKIFKEATGEGFVKYLTAIRIEKAKELLTTTEYSMREVGSMCGYSDPNYFSRSFKKNAGITPSDYKALRE